MKNKGMLLLSTLLSALLLLTSETYKTVDSPCGGIERWDVKTLTDKDSSKINFTPIESTVSDLIETKVPFEKIGNNSPRTGNEFNVYSITVHITFYKYEADKDIHIVVCDLNDKNKTMICEIPDATCPQIKSSSHVKEIEEVAKEFLSFKKTAHSIQEGTYVLTGVGFYDKLHGQTGLAPNGIELHPLLSIKKL